MGDEVSSYTILNYFHTCGNNCCITWQIPSFKLTHFCDTYLLQILVDNFLDTVQRGLLLFQVLFHHSD